MNYNFGRINCTNNFTKSIAESLNMEKLWDASYENILSDDEETPLVQPENLTLTLSLTTST